MIQDINMNYSDELIYMDNEIRRMLGEEPKIGTLGNLTLNNNVWRFDSRQHGGIMIEWSAWPGDQGCTFGMSRQPEKWNDDCPIGYVSVPNLEFITEPLEALRAIFMAMKIS